jgi:hypothetical protein
MRPALAVLALRRRSAYSGCMLSRFRFRTLLLALIMALGATLALAALAAPRQAAASAAAVSDSDSDDEEVGALIGDLVFHADLLAALDRLCPPRTRPADWHGALQPLLEQSFTPELRDLSRRLGADAGSQLVQQRGGCHTRGFGAAYSESKDEYRALFERWRALGQ